MITFQRPQQKRLAGAGENVGHNRLTPLTQFEGDDERWPAQIHPPNYHLANLGRMCFIDAIRLKIGVAK